MNKDLRAGFVDGILVASYRGGEKDYKISVNVDSCRREAIKCLARELVGVSAFLERGEIVNADSDCEVLSRLDCVNLYRDWYEFYYRRKF